MIDIVIGTILVLCAFVLVLWAELRMNAAEDKLREANLKETLAAKAIEEARLLAEKGAEQLAEALQHRMEMNEKITNWRKEVLTRIENEALKKQE